MKEAAILGNGPGLTEVALGSLPEAALLIGVNASFDFTWTPIICTVDTDFCLDMGLPGERPNPTWGRDEQPALPPRLPLCFVLKSKLEEDIRLPEMIQSMNPKWIQISPGAHRREDLKPSGVFAIWFACEVLEMERVFLLGFGGTGHFKGRRLPPAGKAYDRNLGSENRKKVQREFPDVEFVRVYEDGSHH